MTSWPRRTPCPPARATEPCEGSGHEPGWLALGAAVTTSTWWNVPVPPGVVPTDSDLGTSHESTIVFLGLAAVVEASF